MNYSYIFDDNGAIVGFWFADPSLGFEDESTRDSLSMVITAAMIRDGYPTEQITPLTARVIAGAYRSTPNTINNHGGCFILVSDQAWTIVSRPRQSSVVPPSQPSQAASRPRRSILQSLRRELESSTYVCEDPKSDFSVTRRYKRWGSLAGGILGGILMMVIAAFQPIDGKPGYQFLSTTDYSFLLVIGFTFVAGAMGLGYVGAKVGAWLGNRAVRKQ